MDKKPSDGPGLSRRDFFQSMFKGLASTAGSLASTVTPGIAAIAKASEPVGPLLAVVDNARCLMGQGQDCDECVKACPVSPKAISVSAVGLSAGVNAARCTGCGDCVKACPAKAISSKAKIS